MTQIILVIAGAYALGCIVGAYYIVRLRSGVDIRAIGSGTAGARNVMRSGDRIAAVLSFLWDAAKGAIAAYLAQRGLPQPWAGGVALIFAVIGHVWPAQLGFRGGKGVATAIGGTLTLAAVGQSWPNFAAAVAAWTVVAIAHRPHHRGTHELRLQDRHRARGAGASAPAQLPNIRRGDPATSPQRTALPR